MPKVASVGPSARTIRDLEKLPNPYVTYGTLKLNPEWDSLRGYPRFEKIVASLAPRSDQ